MPALHWGLQDFATRCIRPERMSQMQISHVISAVERHYFRRTLPDMVMSETEDIAAFALCLGNRHAGQSTGSRRRARVKGGNSDPHPDPQL